MNGDNDFKLFLNLFCQLHQDSVLLINFFVTRFCIKITILNLLNLKFYTRCIHCVCVLNTGGKVLLGVRK